VKHYFLNSNFKIVKVQEPISFSAQTLSAHPYPPNDYGIYEEDENGNILTKEVMQKPYLKNGKPILNTKSFGVLFNNDGMTPSILRKSIAQTQNFTKEFIRLSRTKNKTWDDFVIPPLNYGFMISSGFYQYGSEFYHSQQPFENESLMIKY